MQIILPPRMELLFLLYPSSVNIENVATTVPRVTNPVLSGNVSLMSKDELKAYRERQHNFKMAIRNGGHVSTSSRGGRRPPSITSQDVLGALEGMGDLHDFFVLGFIGMLRQQSMLQLEKMVFDVGNDRNGMFSHVPLDEFRPVFRCAWYDFLNPCSSKGEPRTDIGTVRALDRVLGCGRTTRGKRVQGVHHSIISLLLGLAVDVDDRLRVGLHDAA